MKTIPLLPTARHFGVILSGLVAMLPAAAEPAATKDPKDAPPVMMEAFKVDSNYMPKLSFGLSLNVWKDNNTQKVISIEVGQVRPGSVAEKKGLQPRARIERVDGRPVSDYTASFRKGTELNELFVNRRNGDKIILEFTVPGLPGVRSVTLSEHRNTGLTLPSKWERLEN